MATIIIASDLSPASENAITFICEQLKGNEKEVDVLLLHVYSMPAPYTADGMALASISEGYERAEQKLEREKEWLLKYHPSLKVQTRITVGTLLDCLEDQVAEAKAGLVVVGLSKEYSDISMWDTDVLSAIMDLPVPVLTVPEHVKQTAIKSIAFACNYRNISERTPINTIKGLVQFTGAKLHVVYVSTSVRAREKGRAKEVLLHEMLHDLDNVEYHTLDEPHVVDAVGRFIRQHDVDCLLVIPRKHGIWESIFQTNHAKELTRLNRVPVIALHERQE